MSNEVESPKKILTTEELLSDFFFLIFCPNPNKNNVRVIIDDGTIKLYTNIPKFIKIIEGTMDEKAGTIVKNCCETYGCYYVIDRCENSIRKLNISSEEGVINLQQLHSDIQKAKESGETDDALREKYFDTLNSFTCCKNLIISISCLKSMLVFLLKKYIQDGLASLGAEFGSAKRVSF